MVCFFHEAGDSSSLNVTGKEQTEVAGGRGPEEIRRDRPRAWGPTDLSWRREGWVRVEREVSRFAVMRFHGWPINSLVCHYEGGGRVVCQ